MSETQIHPTAVVEPGAQLGAGVIIGAFCYIGPEVKLGDDCVVHHHATVDGLTSLGEQCEVFPYACLGMKTQDLKYQGGRAGVRIGRRNVFREFVTVHAATGDGAFTVVGDDNVILAYSHIAHDCVVGNHVIASNNATFAGHVHVGDYAVIGGFGGVHQFCRIGRFAMISACSKVVKDVPPFMLADGTPAVIRGINKVGLERAGFSVEQMERVKAAHRALYRAGLNRSQALAQLGARADSASPEIADVLKFAHASERGLSPGSSE